MQLGGDAVAIAISFGRGETFAESSNLVLTSAAPANLGAAAGCGHSVLLIRILRWKYSIGFARSSALDCSFCKNEKQGYAHSNEGPQGCGDDNFDVPDLGRALWCILDIRIYAAQPESPSDGKHNPEGMRTEFASCHQIFLSISSMAGDPRRNQIGGACKPNSDSKAQS